MFSTAPQSREGFTLLSTAVMVPSPPMKPTATAVALAFLTVIITSLSCAPPTQRFPSGSQCAEMSSIAPVTGPLYGWNKDTFAQLVAVPNLVAPLP